MNVRVSCPECRAVASVEEQSLGRRGRCKKCGHVFALARPGGEPASAISGDASAWKGSAAGSGSARRPASPTNLPEQFGRYRIMRQLGQGGMGAVYLAHDTRLDRQVALKVPFFHPADGPQAVQRFEREARAAATLDHPNLCPVFDVGEIDGIHYLTMPYIEGKPFTEAIGRDRITTEAQAAAVARKLALALQEAHAGGVIHRDLKPANIMVNRRRDLVIMDFGLARMAGGDDGALTRTGHVLGTALYMAPEQAAGDVAATGPGCDIYALGVILFELLTGYRPFEGPWSLVIGLKNVKDPDPPSKHRPDLSPAMDAICLKAIAQRPEDRYATMAEFAEALTAFLAVANVPAPAVTPSGTAPPVEKPESLAAQVFAGIITQEVTSLREDKSAAPPKPADTDGQPPRPPSRSTILAAAGGAAASLLLGIIIYVATDKGRIMIEVSDPRAVVKIDGEEVRVEGLGEPITLRAGDHELLVKQGNGEFETKRFVVRRGDNEVLKIEREPKDKGIDPPRAVVTRKVPADASPFMGNQYKVFHEEMNWHEARKKCEGMGGHLAVVQDEDENRFLTSLVSSAGLDAAWLGATDEQVEGRWAWVDGTEMRYENWEASARQPNNHSPWGTTEQYLLMLVSRNGAWWDLPDKASPQFHPGFVCEWGDDAPRPSNRRIVTQARPGDVKPFAGKDWKVFPEKMNWHAARIRCEEMGGNLAVVKSEEENRFLVALISAEGLDKAWLGASDEREEGRWTWVDGTEMQYAPWAPGQPTNRGFYGCPEHYLEMAAAGNGTWDDVPNGWLQGFVCQWDAKAAGETAPASTTDGYKSLFNGKNLAGWTGDLDGYEVRNGAVSIKPGRRATIYYPTIYWDFVARVEFRLSPGGNSGLAIHYPGDGDPAYSGLCEIQILDDTSPNYAGIDPRAAHGSAFGLVAARPGSLRPLGQWNTQEVTVRGSRVKVELNGVTILDTDLGPIREFMKNNPHPGKDRKGGYFGLTGIDFPVEFRKVEIKELGPAAADGPRSVGRDAFQTGTVWTTVSWNGELTVLERRGTKFRARFALSESKTIREFNGTIENNRIEWLAKDVRAIKGNQGHDNRGIIDGDEISMAYSRIDLPGSGEFKLRLKR